MLLTPSLDSPTFGIGSIGPTNRQYFLGTAIEDCRQECRQVYIRAIEVSNLIELEMLFIRTSPAVATDLRTAGLSVASRCNTKR